MLLAGTCEVLLVSGSWHSWQAHVAACVCDFQPNKSRSVHFGSALKLWMASSLVSAAFGRGDLEDAWPGEVWLVP